MYTHIGYRLNTSYVHSAGGGLYGHADYNGKTHALNGPSRVYEGGVYTALCGKTVRASETGYSLSVRRAEESTGKDVTCRACRRLITATT